MNQSKLFNNQPREEIKPTDQITDDFGYTWILKKADFMPVKTVINGKITILCVKITKDSRKLRTEVHKKVESYIIRQIKAEK